ncbi:MAG: aminotransferase class V-fold PLP-dependent enzyme [Bacteroidia bacterium]
MNSTQTTTLEKHFAPFRKNIVGIDQRFNGPYGEKTIVYTDWTASGRLYRPIEEKMLFDFGPFVANTHTDTNVTGSSMTAAYHHAKQLIKQHVNANENDVLIFSGTGMTGVVNKLQRMLGIKLPENMRPYTQIPDEIRPVVFVSHMEHHSNQTSWYETIADVVVIPCDETGLFSLSELEKLLQQYQNRSLKICAITSGSNVTGLMTPYHEVAKLMHRHQGLCFVDFACSGPYIHIDMHPAEPEAWLDAIYFSPHKFLGGPGTTGVLVFNKQLYKNSVPDCPGGGTVVYTNPWGLNAYIDDIEEREDGGTPGFLQAIRTALCVQLKEQMGVDNMLAREHELLEQLFERLERLPNLHILAGQHKNRLGVVSFYIDDLHFNLAVKLLNDRYGIQTRGGCSCAGTYGHYLLNVDENTSLSLLEQIQSGQLEVKPGWVRLSIHPTTTDAELAYVCEALEALCQHHREWANDYAYDTKTNTFKHLHAKSDELDLVLHWFDEKQH